LCYVLPEGLEDSTRGGVISRIVSGAKIAIPSEDFKKGAVPKHEDPASPLGAGSSWRTK